MFKMAAPFKKIALAALVLAIGLAAFPITGTMAAGLDDQGANQPENSRLERVWAREQAIYQREGTRLAHARIFIGRVQVLINKANQKGWDTSTVQAALNGLSAIIPSVQAAHAAGAAIVASHAGFDTKGKVTDRNIAIGTARSLAEVLKDTRTAMAGTGRALHAAIRTFREAHPRPATSPAS
jgi:hypothetical protein